KILSALEGARLDAARFQGRDPLLVLSRIRLSKRLFAEPLDPGEAQDVACIDFIMVGSGPGDTVGISSNLWSLQATDHALARAIHAETRIITPLGPAMPPMIDKTLPCFLPSAVSVMPAIGSPDSRRALPLSFPFLSLR